MTSSLPSSISLQRIAEAVFGSIDWKDSEHGFARCPGAHLHTTKTGKRDCEVFLNGTPWATCFHSSCSHVVEEASRRMLKEISRARGGGRIAHYRPTADDLRKREQARRDERLRKKAIETKAEVIRRYSIEERLFRQSSPISLCDPREDWRLLLAMFPGDATVWIGDKTDSAADDRPEWQKAKAAAHFRRVEDWLKLSDPPGNFTCPSTFKNNCHSRSNINVLSRPFLVVESDPDPVKNTGLTRSEMLALIGWMRTFLRLRAVVDTGGKSLHGWFDFPAPKALAELQIILPALGCDRAMFKEAQPCRLPGVFRPEKAKFQSLLWYGGAR